MTTKVQEIKPFLGMNRTRRTDQVLVAHIVYRGVLFYFVFTELVIDVYEFLILLSAKLYTF